MTTSRSLWTALALTFALAGGLPGVAAAEKPPKPAAGKPAKPAAGKPAKPAAPKTPKKKAPRKLKLERHPELKKVYQKLHAATGKAGADKEKLRRAVVLLLAADKAREAGKPALARSLARHASAHLNAALGKKASARELSEIKADPKVGAFVVEADRDVQPADRLLQGGKPLDNVGFAPDTF